MVLMVRRFSAEYVFVPLAAVSNVLADDWNRVYHELNVSVRPRARGDNVCTCGDRVQWFTM